MAMLMMLDEMDDDANRHMQELSSRPAEYDTLLTPVFDVECRLLILFSFRPVPTTQLMNQSQRQLEERDVKLEAPVQNPVELACYLASNFPQTAAMPC